MSKKRHNSSLTDVLLLIITNGRIHEKNFSKTAENLFSLFTEN